MTKRFAEAPSFVLDYLRAHRPELAPMSVHEFRPAEVPDREGHHTLKVEAYFGTDVLESDEPTGIYGGLWNVILDGDGVVDEWVGDWHFVRGCGPSCEGHGDAVDDSVKPRAALIGYPEEDAVWQVVHYCDDCATLATANYNGETWAIMDLPTGGEKTECPSHCGPRHGWAWNDDGTEEFCEYCGATREASPESRAAFYRMQVESMSQDERDCLIIGALRMLADAMLTGEATSDIIDVITDGRTHPEPLPGAIDALADLINGEG